VLVPDLAAAAAELRAEFPGAEVLIDAILRDSVGAPAVRIRPTLLLGEPGAGKTRLARRLGEVLGLPVTVYGSGGVADAAFGGTSRQWSTGRASVPLQAIKRSGRANPLIVLDEVEKAATSDHNGRLVDVLLPMLERETAKGTVDPYLECPVDLSAVSYIATANSTTGIPGPLLSRMRVLRMPRPPRSAVLTLAARIVADIRAERDTDARWTPDLDPEELALVVLHWNGRDLRKLRRLVETVLAGREDLTQRH
jgi:replication-associated recombination protein RarA